MHWLVEPLIYNNRKKIKTKEFRNKVASQVSTIKQGYAWINLVEFWANSLEIYILIFVNVGHVNRCLSRLTYLLMNYFKKFLNFNTSFMKNIKSCHFFFLQKIVLKLISFKHLLTFLFVKILKLNDRPKTGTKRKRAMQAIGNCRYDSPNKSQLMTCESIGSEKY